MASFTAIDFETADYGRDSACAVGIVVVEDETIIGRHVELLRPPRQDFVFTYIHGLTWNDVKNSCTFAEFWPKFESLIASSDFLVAHNAPFDRGVLSACCRSAGIPVPGKRFACTVRAARATWRLPTNKLPAVCAHLGIKLKHHDPLSDAEACARIAIAARKAGTAL